MAPSIGAHSRQVRHARLLRRLGRAAIGAAAVWLAAMVIGFAVVPLGVGGVMIAVAAMLATFAALLLFPRLRAPTAADVRGAGAAEIAPRAQLLLEARRPALPPPAQALVDRIGGALDQLAPQLARLGSHDAAADEARRLLGEHLPGLIDSYAAIPPALRAVPNAGATPEAQLTGGLGVIAREIDELTARIAAGELDTLATRGRFLETRYDGGAG